MIEVARALLAGETILVLGLLLLLRLSRDNFRQIEFKALQVFLWGLFVWIGGIFLQLLMPTDIAFVWGSFEYLSLQILNMATTTFLLAQYGFARFYRNKNFRLQWWDYLVLAGFAFTQVLILGKNTVSSQITFFPSGNAEVLPGAWEAWFSFFTLFLILISVLALVFRFFKAKNQILKKQFAYMAVGCLVFNVLGVLANWVLPAYFNYTLLDFSGPLFFVAMAASLYGAALTARFPDLKLIAHRYLSFTSNIAVYAAGIALFIIYVAPWLDLISLAVAYTLLLSGFWVVWNYSFNLWEGFYNYLIFGSSTNMLGQLEKSLRAFDTSLQSGVEAIAASLGVGHAQWVFAETDLMQKHKPMQDFFKTHPETILVKDEIPFSSVCGSPKTASAIEQDMESLMLAAAVPVLDAQKKLLGILLLEKKVNGQMFSSQEIKKLKHLLGQASVFMTRERDYTNVLNKLKESTGVEKEFVDGLMHEIRHPLMLARNVTDMIDWAHLKPEDQKFLKQSEMSLHELSHKLELIAEGSSWAQDAIPVQKTIGSLAQLRGFIHEDMVKENPDWSNVMDFKWENSGLEKDLFYFDMAKIKRVFVELGKNASFFKGQKKLKMTVRVFEEGKDIVVHYTDNGVGIEEKYWEKIFDLMFVAASSRNEKESGLGLGLTIARGIMRAHGGDIKVLKSEIGKGTTFEIRVSLERYESA